MRSEEILKGNKLIAEFMGAKYDKDTSFPIHPDDLWLPVHGICRYNTIELGKGKILNYHQSWDWLMPAINKASGMVHEKMLNEWENSFCNSFLSGNMSLLYKDLVEFIEWYNAQSK